MGSMAEPAVGRANTPPHSDEAEQAVLGALLMDNRVWDAVCGTLEARHFYRGDHRAIFATVGQLVAASRPADVLTVFEAGGHDLAYLNALCDSVPSIGRAQAYADIIAKRWRARELMRIALTLRDQAMAGDGEDADVVADAAVSALLNVGATSDDSDPKPADELGAAFVDYVAALYEGETNAISTGLKDLDDLTAGGIRPGELWVIGARPSMGKTAFTGTVARHVSRSTGALFVSLEDSNTALTTRHFAALGRINMADLRNPKKAPSEMWGKLTEAANAFSQLKLWIDDGACSTLQDVRRKAQRVKQRGPLGLLVVDYLQLMEDEGDNRNIMLGKVANGIKRLAKELQIGVLLLSQLNREADKRNGPPVMSDLRDSGDIEGAADLIGLLYREARRNPTEANKFHAELHVVKHKNGATDTVHLMFDGAHQRLGNWDGPPPTKLGRRPSGGGMD